MIEAALEMIAKLEERRPKLILAAFLLLTIFLVSGFSLIKTETNPESQVPEDIEAISALNEIRDNLGGGSSSIILIFGVNPEDPDYVKDIRDKKVLKTMQMIEVQVIENEFVTGSSSILDYVDLEESQNEINFRLDSNPIVSNLLSEDRMMTIASFSLVSGMSGEQEKNTLFEVREIIRNIFKPPGLEVKVAGNLALSDDLGSSLGGSIGYVTMLGFIGVFIALYIFFRRPSFVLIAVIPIIFGTLWTYGTLGFIGIPLSTQLTGVFSIIIGLGIDFAIHILHRFEEDRKLFRMEVAIYNAVKHVGKGLTMTSITTIIGFLALLFATLPLLRDFAISLTFGVFYSLVAAIGVIPPVLVLVERRRIRKNKKKRTRKK